MEGALALTAVVLAGSLYGVVARAIAHAARDQRHGTAAPDRAPVPWRELLAALRQTGAFGIALVLAALLVAVLLALLTGAGS
jgi:hypothetical protein